VCEPHGLFGFQFQQNDFGQPVAASLSEPWSARSWWPCKDLPEDKATVTVTVYAPIGLMGISNGTQQVVAKERPQSADSPAEQWLWSYVTARSGKAMEMFAPYVWREAVPVSTYHISVAVADYTEFGEYYTGSAGAFPIRHFVYPQLEAAAREDFAVLPEMLDFCGDVLGGYAFSGEKYGMALFEWDGAMEHPTAVTWGDVLVTGIAIYFRGVDNQTRMGYFFIFNTAVTAVADNTADHAMGALDKLCVLQEDLLPYLQRR